LAASIRVYTGDTTQDRDPTIVANEGLPFTPAYRGTAYIVFEAMQLANYGNRIPNLEFEIIKSISSTALQDPTILLNSNVQEGWIGLGAFGQTMLGRSFADNKRKRVWAGATTQVSTVNYLAYADMNARTTASLQISITPLFPGATYNVVYVPDVDSLILVPRNNGFGTQTLFEISPDTGNIKSQVTWNGTECPFMIFWDEYSKQVFGLTGASGGTSFALLRVAGIIIKGRDLLADFGATATGVFGQFGWRNNLGGIDNISLAVDGYATGLPGLEVVSGITSDPDWLYLQYNTGKLTQVDPLANFKQFVPVAGGFIGPVF
jgi:hypothetical protein